MSSKLREMVRPVITIITIVTLALALFFAPDPSNPVLGFFMKWGGIIMSYYFVERTIEKFVNRKK